MALGFYTGHPRWAVGAHLGRLEAVGRARMPLGNLFPSSVNKSCNGSSVATGSALSRKPSSRAVARGQPSRRSARWPRIAQLPKLGGCERLWAALAVFWLPFWEINRPRAFLLFPPPLTAPDELQQLIWGGPYKIRGPSILPFISTSPAFVFSPDELQVLIWLALCSSLHLPLPWHPPQMSYKRSSGPLFISPPPCLRMHPGSSKCSSRLSLHLGLLLDLPCLRIQPRRATSARLASPSILPFSWTSLAFAFSPDELQALVWPLIHLSSPLAFACTPDELQVLVWLLPPACPSPQPPLPSYSAQTSYKRSSGLSLHLVLLLNLPCLRIQPRRAPSARLALYLSLHPPCLCMHPRRATSARLAFPSILPFTLTSPAFAFSPDELQALVWAPYLGSRSMGGFGWAATTKTGLNDADTLFRP